MKKILFLFFTVLMVCVKAQYVGINTFNPQITLDVMGVPADATKSDGIIAPRLTLAEINAKNAVYGSAQTGAIVYVNNVAGATITSTAQIQSIGYYYFDGTLWKSLESKAGAVVFIATLGSGNGSTTSATIAASAFNTVPLPTILKNIGGGIWSTTNNTFSVPISGTYIIKSSVRLVDGTSSRNVFQAVNNTNADIPDGIWQTNPGTARWTMLYTRIAYFTKGDLLRLYIYSDGVTAPISDASLNIALLSQN
jgi:hypothetical protein